MATNASSNKQETWWTQKPVCRVVGDENREYNPEPSSLYLFTETYNSVLSF
jgi:hypothetical protein